MNVRSELVTARAIDDCMFGVTLLPPDLARRVVLDDVRETDGVETKRISELLGRIAAVDILSEVALPRFDNSAVDGFALHADDLLRQVPLTLKIVGKAAAGHAMAHTLQAGWAARVLTGARVPEGAAAIVLEERTTRSSSSVTFHALPRDRANIRGRGEDVSASTIVVAKGTVLDARHVAILAASGNARIPVKRKLRIGVLSTGDELVEAGSEIAPSAIIDTNGPMLRSLLGSAAFSVSDLGIVPDDPDAVARAMLDAASHLDLLLTSGGVAGSDADHLARAIVDAGGKCETLKLALRPGKPIGKGRVGSMQVLALPGNPVAALVNFLLFGRPLVRALLGATDANAIAPRARTAEVFDHKVGRTEFVPVRIEHHDTDGIPVVSKLGRGGSARLLPLVMSDGFAEIDPDVGDVDSGATVRFHPFCAAFTL
jgi:molybdopterin molybdotransferase